MAPPSKKAKRDDGGSTRAAIDGDAVPRLPHERDESADAGRGPPREVIRQAGRDTAAGRVDTSRAPEADAAYRRQKEAPVRHNRKP